jgi:hypothetical protein
MDAGFGSATYAHRQRRATIATRFQADRGACF